MIQNTQITNCPYCNKLFLSYTLSFTPRTKFYCNDCGVSIYYNTDDTQALEEVIINYNQTENYYLIISYSKDRTRLYCYSKCDKVFPKALSTNYLFSHSKTEIFNKINNLIVFI